MAKKKPAAKPKAKPAPTVPNDDWTIEGTAVVISPPVPIDRSEPTIGLGWFAGSIGEMSREEHIAKLRAASGQDRFQGNPQDSAEPPGLVDSAGTQAATPPSTPDESETETGKIAISEEGSGATSVDNPVMLELSSRASRLPGEGRSGCHERLRRLARSAGLPRGQGPGTAYNWALEQTDRLFAALAEPEPEPIPEVEDPPEPPPPFAPEVLPTVGTTSEPPPVAEGDVSGLSTLPDSWPELPANAQLQVEIAWVTANRLRVRSGTGVDLSKALSPAPSYSALSWLETSILFPAKFADISVKATSQTDDEKEDIRREKLAIAEIRSILGEMLEAGDV